MKRAFFVLLVLLLGCSNNNEIGQGLPFYSEDLVPHWSESDPLRLPEFLLQNQQGKRITNADLSRRVILVNFFFTECQGICPTLTANLAKVRSGVADTKRFLIISYSIAPTTDTPRTLIQFALDRGLPLEGWELVTGPISVIRRLAESYGVDLNRGVSPGALHTEHVLLLDDSLRIRGIYNGTLRTEVRHIVSDVTKLLEHTADHENHAVASGTSTTSVAGSVGSGS